jgi:hypothetical protein
MQKKKQRRNFETQAIINLFAECEPKDVVTYAEMQAKINCDPQSFNGRGYVRTALGVIQDEKGFVFDCVENVGYVRLTNEQIATLVPKKMRKRIESASRRTVKKLECVDLAKLEPSQKQQFFLEHCVMQTVGSVVSESTIKRLSDAQKSDGQQKISMKDMIGSLAKYVS